MRRREFIVFAGASAAFPRGALAQQKVPRIAYLSAPQQPQWIEAFQQGLGDYGYVDGRNILVEFFAAPTNGDLPTYAARAVAAMPDLILAFGGIAGPAAKNATNTIPVVFANVSDPIAAGLVTNLGHPGGNVTGNTSIGPDVVGKQLSIMKEVLPKLKRIAILNLGASQPNAVITASVVTAAKTLAIEPVVVDFVEGQDFAVQFERVVAAGAQAVYVPISTYFGNNRALLIELEVKNMLPILSSDTTQGAAQPFAGVVSYGASITGAMRRSASFVDAILKGAKPGDLPVEQPLTFDFGINLRVAKALGITIPLSILAQATLVVEEDGSVH